MLLLIFLIVYICFPSFGAFCCLSNFDTKGSDLLAQVGLQGVDFVVRQGSVHRPVGDAVALGGLSRFGVGEFVREFHSFHQITGNPAGQFEEIVLNEIFWQPKGNILEAGWVFGIGLELGDGSGLELLVESLVVCPEETNVGDLEQNHGQSLQTESKGPSPTVILTGHLQHLRVHHPASQYLEPFALVKNFALHGWFRKGKEILGPFLFDGSKQVVHQSLQHVLEVVGDHFTLGRCQPFLLGQTLGSLDGVLFEKLDSLQLVKGRIVGRIDFVPSVDIPSAQESFVSFPQVHRLVSTGVGSQQRFVVDVVRIGRRSSGVVRFDSQVVEALGASHDGILGVEDFVFLVERVEIILDLGPDDSDGMVFLGVESSSDQSGNVGRDVVVRVVAHVSIDVGVRRCRGGIQLGIVDTATSMEGCCGNKGIGRRHGRCGEAGCYLTEFHLGAIVVVELRIRTRIRT
mmetsp:Transcript_14245/g.29763  ORF Transcript_14245/g.29763 Transcript_14245/m.29763 type:complete len:459 (+) Transcript_14245:77-1453(+)